MAAVVYDGYFVATFLTSHDDQAYSVGIERAWATLERDRLGVMIGFRIGLVYGYDEQLGWIAEAVPVLPFTSPLIQARLGPIVADFTHTWVVVSLSLAARF